MSIWPWYLDLDNFWSLPYPKGRHHYCFVTENRRSEGLARRWNLANFKVVTQRPAGVTFDLAGGSYELEMESLSTIGAEIVEIPATTEEEFIESARDCDALIARGRRITKNIIDNLDNCKVISLGSVGAD